MTPLSNTRHGVKKESADGASAADGGAEDPSETLDKIVLSGKEKKMKRLMERKMQT